MTNDDLDFLRARYARARQRYRPRKVRVLLLAEAPPDNPDRYFYFEDVRSHDSLFLEVMGVLYPDEKKAFLASGRDPAKKEALLEGFAEDGFWLMNVSETSFAFTTETLTELAKELPARLETVIERATPILLIQVSVYDACFAVLRDAGFNVIDERIPFPGSGQQRVFRERFGRAIAAL